MKRKKLTYRFHNPNPDKVMETYIQQIMVHHGVDQVFVSLENDIPSITQKEDFSNAMSHRAIGILTE